MTEKKKKGNKKKWGGLVALVLLVFLVFMAVRRSKNLSSYEIAALDHVNFTLPLPPHTEVDTRYPAYSFYTTESPEMTETFYKDQFTALQNKGIVAAFGEVRLPGTKKTYMAMTSDHHLITLGIETVSDQGRTCFHVDSNLVSGFYPMDQTKVLYYNGKEIRMADLTTGDDTLWLDTDKKRLKLDLIQPLWPVDKDLFFISLENTVGRNSEVCYRVDSTEEKPYPYKAYKDMKRAVGFYGQKLYLVTQKLDLVEYDLATGSAMTLDSVNHEGNAEIKDGVLKYYSAKGKNVKLELKDRS